jgi:hypothetical protein
VRDNLLRDVSPSAEALRFVRALNVLMLALSTARRSDQADYTEWDGSRNCHPDELTHAHASLPDEASANVVPA